MIVVAAAMLLSGLTALGQNYSHYVMYSGSYYIAHVKENSEWKVVGRTSFGPECVWRSNTNNYWFEDAIDGTLYLKASSFEADATLEIAPLTSQDQLSMNAVGVAADQVHLYYFYNWDFGMAVGRQLSSGSCPTEYNSPGSECWQAYWVVYDGSQWKLSSTASYDIVPHASTFRRVKLNDHPLRVTGSSGGIGNLADHTLSYSFNYSPSVTYTNYIDTIQEAYTTYMISEIECTGNWPNRTCDTTWTVHNYYGDADHGNVTPALQYHSSHDALTDANYHWTLSGPGADYLSFDNSSTDMVHDINVASPTVYFRNLLTSGQLTATLTVTVTYDRGATQTRTATITLTSSCGNPRVHVVAVNGNEATVGWAHTSTAYQLRYRYESSTTDDWIETIDDIGDVTEYTITGLEYSSDYYFEVAAECTPSTVVWTGAFNATFTTGRTPKLMIAGAVFGGGRMADIEGKTKVTVANCDTITAVYGGNDIAGHVKGTSGSTIVIGSSNTNDQMHIGSVYGGGNGFYTYNGVTDGDAIGSSGINAKQFTSYNDKGSSTSVSVAGDIPTIVKSDITVNSEFAHIDSLFGGAKNAYILKNTDAEVTTNITINNGTIYSVFGGNNIGGDLAANTVQQITVNGTTINKNLNIHNTAYTGWGRDFGIRYLFGGGNKVNAPASNIVMQGGQVDSLFGGGNSATVGGVNVRVACPFANVTGDWTEWDKTITKAIYNVKPSSSWTQNIDGTDYTGTYYNELYSNRYNLTSAQSELLNALNALSSTFDSLVIDHNYQWSNTGTYNIRALFGGNNQAEMNVVPSMTLVSGGIGTVYGGGNAGPMKGKSASTTIDGTSVFYGTHVETTSPYVFIDRLYGGCQQSDVDWSTWVELNGGSLGYVFGGCNISGDVGSKQTNSSAAAGTPEYYAVQGGCWVDVKDGRVYKNVFGGSDGFYHCNNDLKYIAGINYTDSNYVGKYIPTHNETHVYMTGGTVMGNVYAGGNLANVGFPDIGATEWISKNYPNTSGLASVHISGGKVIKNVFGGGNMASIYGINDVLVDGGEIHGALYGGNDRAGSVRKFNLRSIPYAMASDDHTATGDITTYVRVTDRPYINTIFGGGNGDYDYTENSDVQLCGDPNLIKPIQTGSFVDINIKDGGYGKGTGSNHGVTTGTGGGYIGTVYGGGDGVYVNGSITVMLNVEKSGENWSGKDNVGTIFGGNNKGDLTIVPDILMLMGQAHDVYGGSNQGIMNGIIEHNIAGVVEIGSYVRLMKRYYPTGGVAAGYPVEAVVSGNVYGGCRLSDVVNSSLVVVEGGDHSKARIFGGNDISGTIHGVANVIIDSIAVVKEVYGGGNGLYKYNANGNITTTNAAGTDDTILATMVSATRPFCTSTDVELKGGTCNSNVYGGGLAGDCGNTNLNVHGTGVIKGNLFGGGCGIVDSIGVGNLCSTGITHTQVGNVTGTATTTLHSMDGSAASTLSKVYGGGHNSNCANTDVTLLPSFNHSLNYLYGGCVAGDVSGTANIKIRHHDDGLHTTVDTLYGGNDFSGLVKNTVITIDSGRFNNVFGAGNGNYKYGNWLTAHHFTPSMICVDTVPYSMDVTLNFNGGYYVGNVYGGGNLGLVGDREMVPADMMSDDDLATRNAKIGKITLNIHNPSYFARHVFAGARGLRDMKRTFFKGNTFTGANSDHAGRNVNNSSALGKQLVYGQKIVNMDGGIINLSLYGGSESVDDGFPYECIGNETVYYYSASRLTDPDYRRDVNHNSTMRPSTVINIVGGNIKKNVYGSGYQGNGYGSVYVNIGRRAINESPVWTNSYGGYSMAPFKPVIKNKGAALNPGELGMGNDLILEASVYNGSDWGEAGDMAYFNTRGFYGGETNIFVDGDGYYTTVDDPVAELQYPMMNIAFNLMGSGISTEGGDVNRLITMRHYGNYYDCERVSREMFSIQRADKVILDSVFILLKGEQDAFSAYTSSNYSLNRIDTLIFVNDNIITIDAPGSYIGNLVSMKPNADPTYTLINDQSKLVIERTVMEQHLPSSADCSTGNINDLHTHCDDLSFCDKLPVMRGESGYTGKYNTLVMRNGCYVRVASFVDEHDNNLTSGDAGYNRADGKDDATTYGHVLGWMYMTSEDNTQSYVYAADKIISSDQTAHSDWSLMNQSDGGFVGLCACENVFTAYPNELNYEHVNQTYRSWRVGTYLGRRTRNIALVANSVPDGVLNWSLPTSGNIDRTTNNGSVTPTGSTFDISSTAGNDHLAYATTVMELPPSEPGNFYLIKEVIVDQDNGYQMQLIDQGYEAATHSVFSAYTGQAGLLGLDNIYLGNQAVRNKTFGLTFSTQFDGSNFDQDNCWNGPSSPTQTNGPDDDHRRPLTDGSGRLPCWPISSISGNPYWSQVNGYLSRAVEGDGGVVPSMMFTLTYDKRLSSTLTRDVLFVIDEYDAQGNYVGPIDVTITISTVIREFNNMDATVYALYNEGVANEFSRVVTIPSSFMERGLYLKGIEWENNFTAVQDPAAPISPNDPIPTGTPAQMTDKMKDWFYLQNVDKTVAATTVSDGTRIDNGKIYIGNNIFSLTVSPSENSSDKTNNHLAWMDINEAARNLDVYQTALDDYRASILGNDAGADPTFYDNNWDFTNGSQSTDASEDLRVFNKTRKYNSLNYNDATAEGDMLKTNLNTKPLYIGTLDGRSTAGLEVKLNFNGDYVYHECLDNPLGVVKLHFYWENTKYQNSEEEVSSRNDRGDITLTINLCTREHGDTIYMAPGNSLNRTAFEPTTSDPNQTRSVTVNSFYTWAAAAQQANPSVDYTFGPAQRVNIINQPNRFLNTFREALTIFIPGDVIAVMQTIPVNSTSEATTIHGDDFNRIQIIRYSGSHKDFPTLGCANRNALIEVKDYGRLYLRNVWLNGSGCTRTKYYNQNEPSAPYEHKREPATLLAHAPVIYCHNHGEVDMSANVWISNNFNRAQEQIWQSNAWVDNPDVTHINGGAIALVKDMATGIAPKVVMGDDCKMFDNLVVDWKTFYEANHIAGATALTQPLNYGGAIYMNGGALQLGTLSTETESEIDISRNFYLSDTNMTTPTRLRKRYELSGSSSSFSVYYLDTVRQPQLFRLSNIHLTREPSTVQGANPVRCDSKSDRIEIASPLAQGSQIGINKWFPGYKYNETGHYLNNGDPRDTIIFATNVSNKPLVAENIYAHKNFFNDSSYYYDNSHNRAANDYYTGAAVADSLAPRFVPISNDYTAYHEALTDYPAYNDQVWQFYHRLVSKTNLYLQRCATFGAGMRQVSKTETVGTGSTAVTLHYNDFEPGDSIYYLWDKNATCVASTDTIITIFGGGFFPYSYQWYNDSLIDETPIAMKRIPIRKRITDGDNSIATIYTSTGEVNARNALKRFRSTHDTLVLRSLVQSESAARSTYFYDLLANDATGHCKVNLPVMVRIAKVAPNDDVVNNRATNYYVDSSNFLRHRNPYASYIWYSGPNGRSKDGFIDVDNDYTSYYTKYPVATDQLQDPTNPEQGAGIRYDYSTDPNLPALPAANLATQKIDRDNNGNPIRYYWVDYSSIYDEFMKIVTTDAVPDNDGYGPDDEYPYADYYYYRIGVPGVDSSSFHDHVSMGEVDNKTVFFNSIGDTLYPYIYGWNESIETQDEFLEGKNRSDTVGYIIARKRSGVMKYYRTNPEHRTVEMSSSLDGPWSSAERDMYAPRPTLFWPKRYVPYHEHGEVSDDIAGRGGIRRAGYSHVPMHWFRHGYNRGTLDDRIKAESFIGKPYEDSWHMIADATYYPNGDLSATEISTDSIPSNLYSGEMVPRYLRVYRSYHIYPDIYPKEADSLVRAYAPDVSDFATAEPLDLKHDEFCPGDIVQLVPIAKKKSSRWPGQGPGWRYTAWDFDASSDSIATFVVSAIRVPSDTLKNQPVAYFTPGDYWWQHVTSLPPATSYVRHNNGDVTIKDSTGLAWLISVVNGYNGQNARTFRYNRVYIDFDSVNMSRYRWTPIGNRNNPFEGEIYVNSGKKAKITGINVNETTVPLLGMFGYVNRAKLNGINLDSTLISGISYVGGLVGYADTNTQINKVSMKNIHLFGEQYTGGIAAQSYRTTFDRDTIRSVSMRGNAVTAGGVAAIITGSMPRNTSVNSDIRRLSAIYFGGAVGRIERDENPNQPGGKSENPSRIENNYIHIVSDGTTRRVGGILGYGQYADVQNNYVYGNATGGDYTGGLVGFVGSNLNISNCYYVNGMAKSAWGYNTHHNAVHDYSTFQGEGMNVILTERVNGHTNLLRALNRWVFNHGDSIYLTWRSADIGENSGYPVFGDPEMILVTDSVNQTTCDEIEWDGITFTESGRYIFHVVDSSDYLDSTFILNLTVHYGDSTNVSDSVVLGNAYSGYGLEISAAELQSLFGDDMSREVVALRYVDSLLTANGCDSLVVVTLYVVNENVNINSTTQQLNNIKIYPNPTRGIVNVEGDDLQSIEVYDNVSRRILSRQASSNHERFDLSNQPAGSYYIRVRTASGTVVQKIIKK